MIQKRGKLNAETQRRGDRNIHMTPCGKMQDSPHRSPEATPEIAVIDYGLGNLRSVTKALEAVGATAELTSDPRRIISAKGAVLPGVGAFSAGMKNLESRGMLPAIRDRIADGKPLLGICLGLQLLFDASEEHGFHKGLEIVNGKVERFGEGLKIPHMGWNSIKPADPNHPIWAEMPEEPFFYFVHSYYVVPKEKSVVAATTEYGVEFASAIARDNLFAVQFHPEKSGDPGLKILENFVNHVG